MLLIRFIYCLPLLRESAINIVYTNGTKTFGLYHPLPRGKFNDASIPNNASACEVEMCNIHFYFVCKLIQTGFHLDCGTGWANTLCGQDVTCERVLSLQIALFGNNPLVF